MFKNLKEEVDNGFFIQKEKEEAGAFPYEDVDKFFNKNF